MPKIHQFDKQPSEFSLFGIDMDKAFQIEENAILQNSKGALSLVVTDVNNVDVSASIIDIQPYIFGRIIQFGFKSGVDGEDYSLKLLIPTTFEQLLEEDGILTVVEVEG